MEIINKKYLIKTKNSKIIFFVRGGILSFSTNKENEKFQIQNTQNRLYKFYPDG